MAYGTSETRDSRSYPYKVPVLKALGDMGFALHRRQRGSLPIAQGPVKIKRCAFTYRVGDGHVITRWGRVVEAKCTGPGRYIFATERGWT